MATLERSREEVRLGPLTTLRVGGPARTYVEAHSEAELISVVAALDAANEPVLLLGGGSNVVIGDGGFPGTVVHVRTAGIDHEFSGDHVYVTAAAGERWDRLVAQTVHDGWSGLEALSGIPGCVAATPIQNVGAYGHEVAEFISEVDAYDRTTGSRHTIAAQDCDFSYRSSKFKRTPDRWIVLSVTFRLAVSAASATVRYADLAERLGVTVGESSSPTQVRRAVLAVRRSKGMVLDIDDHDTWSVGSFFTNPVVADSLVEALPGDAPRWSAGTGLAKVSAAWLIERSGFPKGWPNDASGPASLSTKHSLAITNRGGARTADVLDVASRVRAGVHNKTGITLETEPTLINCSLRG